MTASIHSIGTADPSPDRDAAVAELLAAEVAELNLRIEELESALAEKATECAEKDAALRASRALAEQLQNHVRRMQGRLMEATEQRNALAGQVRRMEQQLRESVAEADAEAMWDMGIRPDWSGE